MTFPVDSVPFHFVSLYFNAKEIQLKQIDLTEFVMNVNGTDKNNQYKRGNKKSNTIVLKFTFSLD